MNSELRNNIDKFYDEKEELDIFGLMELAEILIPQLDKLVSGLEKENGKLYGRLNMISDIIEEGRRGVTNS